MQTVKMKDIFLKALVCIPFMIQFTFMKHFISMYNTYIYIIVFIITFSWTHINYLYHIQFLCVINAIVHQNKIQWSLGKKENCMTTWAKIKWCYKSGRYFHKLLQRTIQSIIKNLMWAHKLHHLKTKYLLF